MDLLSAFQFKQVEIIFFLLSLVRWLFMINFIPLFGSLLLPSTIKILLACVFALTSYFTLDMPDQIVPSLIFLLFIKEALIGFILGFLISLWFYAYEYAGQLMDFTRGASMQQILVPEVRHQSSVLGSMFFQFFLVIFLSFNLHRTLIKNILESFKKFPVSHNVWPNKELIMQDLWLVFAHFIELSVRFAFPVILVCFLIDWGFGLINRIAPQINAYFLSLPIKILAGIFIVLCMLSLMVQHIQEDTISFSLLR